MNHLMISLSLWPSYLIDSLAKWIIQLLFDQVSCLILWLDVSFGGSSWLSHCWFIEQITKLLVSKSFKVWVTYWSTRLLVEPHSLSKHSSTQTTASSVVAIPGLTSKQQRLDIEDCRVIALLPLADRNVCMSLWRVSCGLWKSGRGRPCLISDRVSFV